MKKEEIIVKTNMGLIPGRVIRTDCWQNPLEIITSDFQVYEKDIFSDLFYPKY